MHVSEREVHARICVFGGGLIRSCLFCIISLYSILIQFPLKMASQHLERPRWSFIPQQSPHGVCVCVCMCVCVCVCVCVYVCVCVIISLCS